MRDISDHKWAEEALRDSEVRYRRLFEAAKDGILILDAETGVIIDVNPFLIEMLRCWVSRTNSSWERQSGK
jgi:PAS domain-containing protein